MRLNELYRSGKIDFSAELFPPKTGEGLEEMYREVDCIKSFGPAFFSVTYGAAGSTRNQTLNIADRLKNKVRVETTCHLTIAGQSKEEVRSALWYLKGKGIYNLMALRGDPPRGTGRFQPHPDGFCYAVDLVREAKQMNFFSIAVAGFPEMHPDSPNRKADIDYLKQKVDAGADVIVSQLFFDNRFFYDFVDEVRKTGIRIPIIPGILPILSAQQVRRFTELCKATIPDHVDARLREFENDPESATRYGIELATKQCTDLIEHGVSGIHFYCLNRSRSVTKVLHNLGFGK